MHTTCQDAPPPDWRRRKDQPFTVLLLLPDFIRNDACREADWVRRMWTEGQN